MTKYISFLVASLVFLSCNTNVPETAITPHETASLTSEYLKTKTAYFTIDLNNDIHGEGKQVLQDFINASQFIVYGEMHNSKQTSIITKALMPLLNQANFKNFALEVGPSSAKKLSELSTPAEETVDALRAFNTKYILDEAGETAEPIPFFSGISDAEFLQEARSYDMALWGLDQEYYFAPFFLFDELLETASENANFNELKSLKERAQNALTHHFMQEIANANYETYKNILKDEAVIKNYKAFSNSNSEAQKIIKDLKISWDIYIRWRDDSHADRISYMRNNFTDAYNQALTDEQLPKVFTKIGSLHASKIVSGGAFDIGHLTEQLAQKNGTTSTTINTWKPFEIENDTIVNNLVRYKRGFKRYKIFTDLARRNQWCVINLKSIREDLKNGSIALPTNGDYHKLKRLIDGYDYQIMLPVDQESIPNKN